MAVPLEASEEWAAPTAASAEWAAAAAVEQVPRGVGPQATLVGRQAKRVVGRQAKRVVGRQA